MKKFFPILEWLPTYSRAQLKGDLMAGITVGFMLVPQGMAYAMLAGMPPIYGLYAAIVPMLVYTVLGSSRQLSVGPVALDSLLVASGLAALALPGTADYIALAILLALMVGVIQFTAGLLRLGFLVNFVSRPVISGFTSAAAIVIAVSQVNHLLGVTLPRADHFHETFWYALQAIPATHLPTFALGVGGILLILGLRKLHRTIPGALVAVVLSTALVALFDLHGAGIRVVGEVPGGLPAPAVPLFSAPAVWTLLPTAFTLALVAFMEAYSIGKAMEARAKDHRIRPNQDLMALGLGNILGSFFKAFPTAGGFSRTAVNAQAGARTNLAGLISVGFVVLTLLFLTPLFDQLPQAILASVVMVAVVGLVDIEAPVRLWKTDRIDFYLLLATFAATLAFGIMPGIAAGVVLSLIMVIFRSVNPHIAILGRLPGSRHFRNVERFPGAIQHPGVLALRLDAQLYFANAVQFRDRILAEVRRRPGLRLVIVDAEAISFLDSTAVEMLRTLHAELRALDIKVFMAGARGPVRDTLARSGLLDEWGPETMFLHISEALDAWEQRNPAPNPSAIQSNFPKPPPRLQ